MDDAMRHRIEGLVGQSRVVLFMKGTKRFPMCGFSAQVVSILRENGAEFTEVNVLADEALREALKEYSNWPTFPQLYVDGRLVGGADIVSELQARGELHALIDPPSTRTA